MKQIFNKTWPHIVVMFSLALFCIFYFLPENTQNKALPQSDVQHSLSMQTEIRKFQEQEKREILWTNSIFSGMPAYQIYGGGGDTFNFIPRFVYSTMQLTKGITSPTGLLFACCFGFYIMMLCFRFDWKYALAGSILFGLSTSFMHLIGTGHVNKVMVLALLQPTLGAMWLLYQQRYLLGTALTALFVNLQIMTNHPQISYYYAFLATFFVLGMAIYLFRAKQTKTFLIATSLLVLATVVGVLPNLPKLLTTKEYSEETTRGKTLMSKEGKPSDGLEKDYAFGWSLSVQESMTHVIPNFLGGSSSDYFASDQKSNSLRVLQTMTNQEQANQLAQATSKYFGKQSFTSGAWYWGITVVMLFFLGFFSIRSWIRWWGLGSLIFLIFLSWGSYFPAFNYFLFDNFPLFNKFRAVSMAINLGHMILLLIGLIGLREFFLLEKPAQIKAIKLTMIPMGIIVFLGFWQAWMGQLNSTVDDQIKMFPDMINALHQDRAAVVQKDAFRTLFYVLAMAAFLYFFAKNQWNKMMALIVLSLIILIDLVSVDKRYLPNTRFVSKSDITVADEPRPVDQQILQDKDLSFRVIDFTGNPFQDAFVSNFHKSNGGYHSAKLGIYQDVIDKYLSNPKDYLYVYGMLNNKYIIGGDKANPVAQTNPTVMGNAWFAREIKFVDTPEQEFAALGDTANIRKAVVNKSFETKIKVRDVNYDPNAKIALTAYIPDDMTYTYEAATPQFAVFSEVYYPESKGWHVYIDGQRKDGIVRTNYILRGIEVPAGKHTLQMKFEPASYYAGQSWGKLGSVLLIILILGALFQEFLPLLRPKTKE